MGTLRYRGGVSAASFSFKTRTTSEYSISIIERVFSARNATTCGTITALLYSIGGLTSFPYIPFRKQELSFS
jgi:hypothetical protein